MKKSNEALSKEIYVSKVKELATKWASILVI